MAPVCNITTPADLASILSTARGQLVVIDFTATWCPPCRMIAPVYEKLAIEFPQAVFCKNDVDASKEVAQAYGVAAMPTFKFLLDGKVVDELRGADPARLRQLVIKHASTAPPAASSSSQSAASGSSSSFSAGAPSVTSQIDKAQSSCLNEASSKGIKQLLEGSGPLESDADEQLLLSVAMMQSLRLRALRLVTKPANAGQAPKTIKLFINRPTLGFDDAENDAAVQEFELSKEQASGDESIPVKYVLYQRLLSLQIFVASNQGGEDITRIDGFELFGELGDAPSSSLASAMKHDHEH